MVGVPGSNVKMMTFNHDKAADEDDDDVISKLPLMFGCSPFPLISSAALK